VPAHVLLFEGERSLKIFDELGEALAAPRLLLELRPQRPLLAPRLCGSRRELLPFRLCQQSAVESKKQQCGKGSREGFSSGGETATQQVRSRVPQHLAASSLLSLQRLKLLADAGAERRDLLGLEVALRDHRLLLSQERRLLFLVPRARPRALLH